MSNTWFCESSLYLFLYMCWNGLSHFNLKFVQQKKDNTEDCWLYLTTLNVNAICKHTHCLQHLLCGHSNVGSLKSQAIIKFKIWSFLCPVNLFSLFKIWSNAEINKWKNNIKWWIILRNHFRHAYKELHVLGIEWFYVNTKRQKNTFIINYKTEKGNFFTLKFLNCTWTVSLDNANAQRPTGWMLCVCVCMCVRHGHCLSYVFSYTLQLCFFLLKWTAKNLEHNV